MPFHMHLMKPEGTLASRFFRKLASTVGQVWAGLLISGSFAGIAAAAPVNDHFANRTLIPSVPATVTGNTTGSTVEPGDSMVGSSIWWKFTPQASGSYFISSYPNYSTNYRLHLYTGNSLNTLIKQTGQLIAGAPQYTWLEKFELTAGVEYSVLVGSQGYWDENPVTLTINRNSPPSVLITNPTVSTPSHHGQQLELRVDASDSDGSVVRVDYYFDLGSPVASSTVPPFSATVTLPQSPAGGGYYQNLHAVATDNNGAKTTSVPISFLVLPYAAQPANDHFADRAFIPSVPVTVSGTTAGSTVEAGDPMAGRSIWWKFTPQESGAYFISASTDYRPYFALHLYTGNSLNALVKQTGQPIGGTPANTRMEKYELTAGVEYSIMAGSAVNWDYGPVTLALTRNSSPAVAIISPAVGTPYYHGNEFELRVDASDPDGAIARVDYYFDNHWEPTSQPVATSTVAPFTVTMTVPPAGSYYQKVFAVATDNHGAKTISEVVSFLITYYTPSDFFADRKPVTGELVFETAENRYATVEAGETGTSGSIWWSWTAPASKEFSIASRGWPAGFSPRIDVYTGSDLNALTGVASSGYTGSNAAYTAQVSLNTVEGQTYAIRLTSIGGIGGETTLSILPVSPTGTPPQIKSLKILESGKIELMILSNGAASTELQSSPDLKIWTPYTPTYLPNGYFKEIVPRLSDRAYFYRVVEKLPAP